jgi:hypothetical protein
MDEPETTKEWQEAVNLAELYSLVDSAIKYGLIDYSGKINIERCDDILERGRKRNIYPVKAQVDQLIQAFVKGAASHTATYGKGKTRAEGSASRVPTAKQKR